MDKVLALLEECGVNDSLASAGCEQLMSTAIDQGLELDQATALSLGQRVQLEELMKARSRIVCAIFPAKDPEPDSDDDGKEPEPEEPNEPSNRLAA